MEAFSHALANGAGAAAKALFGVRGDLPEGDFAYMLADASAMADQYNHKDKLCEALAGPGPHASDEARMTTFANFVNTFWGKSFASQCFYDTECTASDQKRWQPTARSWWWQKCHELAYFQNAPASGSLRLALVNATYHRRRCAAMFSKDTFPDTVATNKVYGGVSPPTTNVYFSDFSDDPWQQASVRSVSCHLCLLMKIASSDPLTVEPKHQSWHRPPHNLPLGTG